jgi:hypothetical protein
MNNLTVIILFCFTFGWSLNAKSQNSETKNNLQAIEADSFPQSWLGNWVGDLNIYKENKLVQTLPMELEMLAIDTSDNYIWAIIYGEDKTAGRRSYELEILDAEKGIYRIDEKNTIKLECYLFGNKLYSQFSVNESQLLCTYEKAGDKMIFEIISGSTEPISTTGDKTIEEEEIPEVKTFPITIRQKAVLIRKK